MRRRWKPLPVDSYWHSRGVRAWGYSCKDWHGSIGLYPHRPGVYHWTLCTLTLAKRRHPTVHGKARSLDEAMAAVESARADQARTEGVAR